METDFSRPKIKGSVEKVLKNSAPQNQMKCQTWWHEKDQYQQYWHPFSWAWLKETTQNLRLTCCTNY